MTRILCWLATFGLVFQALAAVTPGGGGSGGGGVAASPTNTGLKYISPLPGNNGISDVWTNAPNFVGQIGVGVDAANAGSGVYLYGAKSNSVGQWASQFHFPAGIASIGDEWHTPTNSNYRFAWNYLNGNPKWATRTNIVLASGASVDSGWAFAQMNPYGCALIWTPTTTTNVQYKWAAGSIIGTNATGDVIYWDEDPFGLVVGTISREWPSQETNQAGSYVILLGGGGSTKPFHISDNHTEGGQLGQWSYLTIDRRGLSNVASPWGIGFPIRGTNSWSETNANFRWGLWHDYRDGSVDITNGLTTLHSVYANNTNNGANRFGKWSEAVAPNNFSGGASFNSHINDAAGYYAAWTFDAAAAHRLGYMIKAGSYPVQAFAKGTDFRLVQSSATDLQSGISGQTLTNMLSISNNVLAVHTPGFRVDGNQTNVGTITVAAGTVGLPGIRFNSDDDSGFFAPFASGVDWVANGTASVRMQANGGLNLLNNSGSIGIGASTDVVFSRHGAGTNGIGNNSGVIGTGSLVLSNIITKGNIFQQFALVSPGAPPSQGALYWTDGTNVMATIRNSAGTITTNKLSMTAWP